MSLPVGRIFFLQQSEQVSNVWCKAVTLATAITPSQSPPGRPRSRSSRKTHLDPVKTRTWRIIFKKKKWSWTPRKIWWIPSCGTAEQNWKHLSRQWLLESDKQIIPRFSILIKEYNWIKFREPMKSNTHSNLVFPSFRNVLSNSQRKNHARLQGQKQTN